MPVLQARHKLDHTAPTQPASLRALRSLQKFHENLFGSFDHALGSPRNPNRTITTTTRQEHEEKKEPAPEQVYVVEQVHSAINERGPLLQSASVLSLPTTSSLSKNILRLPTLFPIFLTFETTTQTREVLNPAGVV